VGKVKIQLNNDGLGGGLLGSDYFEGRGVETAQTVYKEAFHLKHAIILEGVMRYFADELGYGDEAEFWSRVGLLHDLDFEMYPDSHCIKQLELMKEADVDERIALSAATHGWPRFCDKKPEHEIEKVLFAVDELTGLIGAAAMVRPSKSVQDMEVKSVVKNSRPRLCRRMFEGSNLTGRPNAGDGFGQAHRDDDNGHEKLRGRGKQNTGITPLTDVSDLNRLSGPVFIVGVILKARLG
jgi:hypothetical protein